MKGRMCTGREWVGGGFLQEGPSRGESGQDQVGGDTLAVGLHGLMRLEAGAAVWERARDAAGQEVGLECGPPRGNWRRACVCCIRHWGAMAGS